VSDYPQMIATIDLVELYRGEFARCWPARSFSIRENAALYVWEWPNYPQVLHPDRRRERPSTSSMSSTSNGLKRGSAQRSGGGRDAFASEGSPRVNGIQRRGLTRDRTLRVGRARQLFRRGRGGVVHPRNPYTRVDALRSTRHVRIELDGACSPTRSRR